ncbi:hypothetical protein NA56DRAFT_28068 [Hyaloscypha hepaticicola]|uniref:Uncharacterized protein n=1 Tax=Hyaloscypha hepaticicola TaxID=2082293 RepID=A0A2J6QCZ9_9HELO|nr:hypothetical protein NA56DRAFT_28068 [Hyaloscypha hepaticicola]
MAPSRFSLTSQAALLGPHVQLASARCQLPTLSRGITSLISLISLSLAISDEACCASQRTGPCIPQLYLYLKGLRSYVCRTCLLPLISSSAIRANWRRGHLERRVPPRGMGDYPPAYSPTTIRRESGHGKAPKSHVHVLSSHESYGPRVPGPDQQTPPSKPPDENYE